MRILSDEGTGTCVELYLPIANISAEKSPSESVDPLTQLAQGEIILVLDPDASVCEAVASQLKEMGYTALQAESPAAALEMLETYVETRVVLMDLMPSDNINGVSLAKEFMDIRDGLKILYTSAHGRATFKQIGIPEDVEDVLFKPYRKADLAIKLHELLDE